MGAEDEWRAKRDGTVFGYSINMTTAVALGLAESLPVIDNENACAKLMTGAIGRGLAALRQLVEYGHGSLIGDLPTGFPVEPLAKILSVPTSQFTVTDVPWWKSGEPLDTPSWMIVELAQRRPIGEPRGPLVGVARRYVVNGAAALANYPQAKFGDLHTLDRFEIETLRSLYRMMTAFKQENRPKRPLSIGVFGPPGAGKSFGVKQISNELFGEDAWLEFNLSQFEDNDDLIGALHQVRDKVLSGIIPVAFWDEFDSELNKWLKDLLAPMQDGRFQQGQISHWVGKCVFVFAGGTSPTYHDFGAHEEDDLVDFKRKKGPDFHSRLDAYYDVLGPNQRERKNAEGKLDSDPNDVCFPLRRAILIRSNLKCKPDELLEFDPDLLDALLLAPKYIHGARSLEKLVAPLGVKIGQAIRRSSLPAKAVIGMHVDVNAFEELLKRNERFSRQKHVDELAARLHKNYLDTHEHSDPPVNQDLDKPFEHLEPVYKEMSRAAARRIPQLLAMVDMGISTEPDSEGTVDKNLVKTYLKEHLEMLAEEEHKGWVQQRKASGWRYGEARDDQKKRHPCIKVYAELDNKYKDNDRNNVLMIPELVGAAGYSIVWLGASNPTE